VHHDLSTIPFSWVPLGTSVLVAFGGLYLGFRVYGRNPLKSGQRDPLIAPLGPLHKFLENKWYWDELYQTVFIKPTIYLSEVVAYEVIDKGIIDGFLHLVARTVYAIGDYVKWFEQTVISDGVDWVKDQFLAMTKEFRQLQTGKIQEYTLVSMLIAVALALVVLAINFGWLSQLFTIIP
jgi:NADH-quinone oxidoreductase subunit L